MKRIVKVIIAVVVTLLILLAVIIVAVVVTRRYGNEEDALDDVGPSEYRTFSSAAVVSASEICNNMGRDTLQRNGSAVDAAIVTMLCNSVVNPHVSGLGGGFIMTIYKRVYRSTEIVDAREMAPLAATQDMGQNHKKAAKHGGLTIAVPGTLHGMFEAHRRYSNLPWSDLFPGVIRLCREGFPVSRHYARAVEIVYASGDYFVTNDIMDLIVNPVTEEYYQEGDVMKRPEYAEILQVIAREGVRAIYDGKFTKQLAKEVQKRGGILSETDLKQYRSRIQNPIIFDLGSKEGNLRAFTAPPPSSGAVLAMIIKILDGYELSADDVASVDKSTVTYHRLLEAFKFAFAKRSFLGDKRTTDVMMAIQNMTWDGYISAVRRLIQDNSTLDIDSYGGQFSVEEDFGTASFLVFAPNGDAVAATGSLNHYWGSKVVSPSTGIVFNDEMRDFSGPGLSNYFGVRASPANYIEPGKRPLSSVCPTIVIDDNGDVQMVIGASGGTRIITSVAQVMINNIWLEMELNSAVDARRLHHQLYPNEFKYESGFPQDVIEELEKLGHHSEKETHLSAVAVIRVNNNGTVTACMDSRRGGIPAGL